VGRNSGKIFKNYALKSMMKSIQNWRRPHYISNATRPSSARLKRLEDAGIVERRFYEQHRPRAEYLLTERGKELRPVLKALFEWGQRHTKYAPAEK
jgi:hypothetical protein